MTEEEKPEKNPDTTLPEITSESPGDPPFDRSRIPFYALVLVIFLVSAFLYCRVLFKNYPLVISGGTPVPQASLYTKEFLKTPEEDKTQSSPTTPMILNINTSPAKDLQNLPGIGKKRAEDIIRYRERNGPFKAPEDITRVPGIGEKTYGNIKDLIKVDDSNTTTEENKRNNSESTPGTI